MQTTKQKIAFPKEPPPIGQAHLVIAYKKPNGERVELKTRVPGAIAESLITQAIDKRCKEPLDSKCADAY